MQGYSAEYAAEAQGSHTAVARVDAIVNGSVVATLPPFAGNVKADRIQGQLRTMQFEVVDTDGTLTPTGMTSLLAPFGTEVQLYGGARIKSETTLSVSFNAGSPWQGQFIGTTTDAGGSLILGN